MILKTSWQKTHGYVLSKNRASKTNKNCKSQVRYKYFLERGGNDGRGRTQKSQGW